MLITSAGGKSAELLTLERCLPAIQDVLSSRAVGLRWLAGKLAEKGFIYHKQEVDVFEGRKRADKAHGLMNVVMAQVGADGEMYHRFCSILHNNETTKDLDKMLTKAYGKLVCTMYVVSCYCVYHISSAVCMYCIYMLLVADRQQTSNMI